MKNIFIFHGAGGSPQENWFPWLRTELEKLGHKVLIPHFPTPKDQTLNNWIKILDNYKEYLSENTIFIGHSVGATFALNIIEKQPVIATFLVSGFTGLLNNKYDIINKTFTQRDFDWDTIKNNCKHFKVFHSDNDPYVKINKAKQLANNLGVDLIVVKKAGHFNQSTGYIKFNLLLEKIKKFL